MKTIYYYSARNHTYENNILYIRHVIIHMKTIYYYSARNHTYENNLLLFGS